MSEQVQGMPAGYRLGEVLGNLAMRNGERIITFLLVPEEKPVEYEAVIVAPITRETATIVDPFVNGQVEIFTHRPSGMQCGERCMIDKSNVTIRPKGGA